MAPTLRCIVERPLSLRGHAFHDRLKARVRSVDAVIAELMLTRGWDERSEAFKEIDPLEEDSLLSHFSTRAALVNKFGNHI